MTSDILLPADTGAIIGAAKLGRRRFGIAILVGVTMVLLTWWLVSILATGRFGILDALLVVCFVVYSPWLALGFWNSIIGFVLLRGARDPLAMVIPPAAALSGSEDVVSRTALAMTIRNEDPARSVASMRIMMESLAATPYGDRFDFYLLSDSSDPAVIAAEEKAVAALQAEQPGYRLTYRRRAQNVGFKAGNLRDFCERWGKDYEFMIWLDTDSLMSAEAILRLVRIIQSHPRLAILQSLAVGLPTRSLFARLFQFGHRNGMHCFVVGAGFWQGDRCQFWGHNAIIRIAPFIEHCRLPTLPGKPPFGGHIICHDQIEAALMYRAGYEVRLLPVEQGSYEGNPPTLPEFVARNARWCLGNLQNLRLLFEPGFTPTNRFHIAFMAQKFIGAAALFLFGVLAVAVAMSWPDSVAFPRTSAAALLGVWLALYFAPRIVSLADALMDRGRRFGGMARLLAGFLIEIVFAILIVPVTAYATTRFIVAVLLGRTITWDGQQREDHRVRWGNALDALWQPTLIGAGLLTALAISAPSALFWFLAFFAGLVLAIPFTVLTSSKRLGALAARWRLCAIPEELDLPDEAAKLLSALDGGR